MAAVSCNLARDLAKIIFLATMLARFCITENFYPRRHGIPAGSLSSLVGIPVTAKILGGIKVAGIFTGRDPSRILSHWRDLGRIPRFYKGACFYSPSFKLLIQCIIMSGFKAHV